MQSVIHKVKSLPTLLRKGVPQEERPPVLSPFQLFRQIDKLQELIDVMIDESLSNMVLVFPPNRSPADRRLHSLHTHCLVPSEILTQQPFC
jgi:hypothetical protein